MNTVGILYRRLSLASTDVVPVILIKNPFTDCGVDAAHLKVHRSRYKGWLRKTDFTQGTTFCPFKINRHPHTEKLIQALANLGNTASIWDELDEFHVQLLKYLLHKLKQDESHLISIIVDLVEAELIKESGLLKLAQQCGLDEKVLVSEVERKKDQSGSPGAVRPQSVRRSVSARVLSLALGSPRRGSARSPLATPKGSMRKERVPLDVNIVAAFLNYRFVSKVLDPIVLKGVTIPNESKALMLLTHQFLQTNLLFMGELGTESTAFNGWYNFGLRFIEAPRVALLESAQRPVALQKALTKIKGRVVRQTKGVEQGALLEFLELLTSLGQEGLHAQVTDLLHTWMDEQAVEPVESLPERYEGFVAHAVQARLLKVLRDRDKTIDREFKKSLEAARKAADEKFKVAFRAKKDQMQDQPAASTEAKSADAHEGDHVSPASSPVRTLDLGGDLDLEFDSPVARDSGYSSQSGADDSDSDGVLSSAVDRSAGSPLRRAAAELSRKAQRELDATLRTMAEQHEISKAQRAKQIDELMPRVVAWVQESLSVAPTGAPAPSAGVDLEAQKREIEAITQTLLDEEFSLEKVVDTERMKDMRELSGKLREYLDQESTKIWEFESVLATLQYGIASIQDLDAEAKELILQKIKGLRERLATTFLHSSKQWVDLEPLVEALPATVTDLSELREGMKVEADHAKDRQARSEFAAKSEGLRATKAEIADLYDEMCRVLDQISIHKKNLSVATLCKRSLIETKERVQGDASSLGMGAITKESVRLANAAVNANNTLIRNKELAIQKLQDLVDLKQAAADEEATAEGTDRAAQEADIRSHLQELLEDEANEITARFHMSDGQGGSIPLADHAQALTANYRAVTGGQTIVNLEGAQKDNAIRIKLELDALSGLVLEIVKSERALDRIGADDQGSIADQYRKSKLALEEECRAAYPSFTRSVDLLLQAIVSQRKESFDVMIAANELRMMLGTISTEVEAAEFHIGEEVLPLALNDAQLAQFKQGYSHQHSHTPLVGLHYLPAKQQAVMRQFFAKEPEAGGVFKQECFYMIFFPVMMRRATLLEDMLKLMSKQGDQGMLCRAHSDVSTANVATDALTDHISFLRTQLRDAQAREDAKAK